jgi:hypothetical protein
VSTILRELPVLLHHQHAGPACEFRAANAPGTARNTAAWRFSQARDWSSVVSLNKGCRSRAESKAAEPSVTAAYPCLANAL